MQYLRKIDERLLYIYFICELHEHSEFGDVFARWGLELTQPRS